jgi:CRISPR-associated protein Csm5
MSQWQFIVTPLTPLHIGSGEAIEPFEYVVSDDGWLYKFAPEDFLAQLSAEDQDEFVKWAGTDVVQARKFLHARREKVQAVAEYRFAVTPQTKQDYDARMENPKSDLGIGVFIRTNGQPYIPGSSLKGALRTASLYQLATKDGQVRIKGTAANWLEARTFDYVRPGRDKKEYISVQDDPFRLFKIGDSSPLVRTRLAEVNVHNFRDAKRDDDKIPLLREVSGDAWIHKASAVVTLTVTCDDETRVKKFPQWLAMPKLIQACRAFYGLHLENESALHARREGAAAYNALRDWDKQVRASAPNVFLARLGWGSGFDAVTVRYGREGAGTMRQMRPRKEKKDKQNARAKDETRVDLTLLTPASRHLDESGLPLGWVEVEVVPIDDAAMKMLPPAQRQPVRVEFVPAETTRAAEAPTPAARIQSNAPATPATDEEIQALIAARGGARREKYAKPKSVEGEKQKRRLDEAHKRTREQK